MKTTMKKNHTLTMLRLGIIAFYLFFQGYFIQAQEADNPGIRMFDAKNYYGSERYFQNTLEKNPENAEAYYYLGRISNANQDLDKATDYFEKAIKVEPSNAEYYAWNGINYVHLLSKVEFMKQAIYAPKAQKNLETAVSLDPGHIDARIWLAGYYANAPSFAGGSRGKAKQQFEAIFEIDPNHPRALLEQGIVLIVFEEYDEALSSFERIIETNENYYPAYFHIGRLSSESKRFYAQGELSLIKFIDQAEEKFQVSKDEAWWYLGDIYQQQGKNKGAREAFEKAVSLDPENEKYQHSLKNIL